MASPISLHALDPDEGPSCHAYYDILRQVIQPDAKITTDAAVAQILETMPKSGNDEVDNVLTTCYEVAEQIPYHHNSQSKLVTLIDLVLTSEKVHKSTGDSEIDNRTRYTMLSQTGRDRWNSSKPSEDITAFIDFQAFTARFFERGMLSGTNAATYTCEDALGPANKPTNAGELSAWTIAASNWILILGRRMYHGALQHQGKDPGTPTLKQWRQWRDELEVASSQKPGKKYADLSEEARALAGKAVEEMKAIERKAGG